MKNHLIKLKANMPTSYIYTINQFDRIERQVIFDIYIVDFSAPAPNYYTYKGRYTTQDIIGCEKDTYGPYKGYKLSGKHFFTNQYLKDYWNENYINISPSTLEGGQRQGYQTYGRVVKKDNATFFGKTFEFEDDLVYKLVLVDLKATAYLTAGDGDHSIDFAVDDFTLDYKQYPIDSGNEFYNTFQVPTVNTGNWMCVTHNREIDDEDNSGMPLNTLKYLEKVEELPNGQFKYKCELKDIRKQLTSFIGLENYLLSLYEIKTYSISIDNSHIYGPVSIKHSVNGNGPLQFGMAACAEINFTTDLEAVLSMVYRGDLTYLKEYVFTYYSSYDDDPLKLKGTFIITEVKKDKNVYKVKGYDYVYLLDKIIDDWLNNLEFPKTAREVFESLCEYCGTNGTYNGVNANFALKDNFETVNITGRTIASYLAELGAGFVIANPNGSLVLKGYTMSNLPRQFPENYSNFILEDYPIDPITKVMNADGIVYSGVGDNVYLLKDNPFLYAEKAEEIQTAIDAIYNGVKDIRYRAGEIAFLKDVDVNVGEIIDVKGLLLYVMDKSVSNGITIKSYGVKYREPQTDSIDTEIKKLRGKSNTLTRDLDETKSVLADVKGEISTVSQKADGISSEVTKLSSDVATQISSINQRADGIESTVSSKVGNDEIISKINQSAEEVSINASKINLNGAVTANNYFKINTDGSMTVTNASVTGYISASEGSIGNWNINKGALSQTSYSGEAWSHRLPDSAATARDALTAIRLGQRIPTFYETQMYDIFGDGIFGANDIAAFTSIVNGNSQALDLQNTYTYSIKPETDGSMITLSKYQYIEFIGGSGQKQGYNLYTKIGAGSLSTGFVVGNSGYFTEVFTNKMSYASSSQTSDRRVKDNIVKVSKEEIDALDTIDAFGYTMNDEKHYGVIAQDILDTAIQEGVVKGTEESYYSVDYSALTALLLASVKDLKKEVAKLKAEVEELKK